MKHILLTQGKAAIVDDEDFERLSSLRWQFNYGYASHGYEESGKIKKMLMHIFIMGSRHGMQIDHINRDKLDNRKENLRHCTRSQNQINWERPNKTGYRGVCFNKGAFEAKLRANGKTYGSYGHKTAKEAGIAYNELALRYQGEFAILNA